MGVVAIACYRPKPGKADELEQLTRDHVPILRKEGLVSEHMSYAMRAQDGTILEVFEWRSKEALESAHTNAEVIKLWGLYAAVCDYVSLSSLAEAQQMFAVFEPIG
jgi:quinol monooxygenase YgiN